MRGENMNEWLGRQVAIPKSELPTVDDDAMVVREALDLKTGQCQRCGTLFSKKEQLLPSGKYYCGACVQFGRLTSEEFLVSKQETTIQKREVLLAWQGKLTPPQQAVADHLLENQQHTMIWAVTGAGKTEMIFPIIQQVLSLGGRVGVTSPRIDVCRELFPRIHQAFPKEKTLLLYGASEEKYRYSKLTVCTTHQLIHFYQAFDLLIVDEIDAFPYEGDPQLRFAVSQAIKPNGRYIYLTATPPQQLIAEIQEEFAIEKLPIRYHQRPLIVPELHWYEHWASCYQRKWHLRKLIRLLNELLKANAVLVFCPSIAYMKKVYAAVKKYFATGEVACVSSQDEHREAKVQAMRDKSYRVLFTTTILERGVTFEHVSVIIMGANHPVYTKSALVQISGRVDRKGVFNHGRVIFFLNQQTVAIRKACQEIKEMNHLAKRWRKDAL